MEGMAWDIFCLLLTGTPRPTLLCPGRLNDVWTELEARTQATLSLALFSCWKKEEYRFSSTPLIFNAMH